MDPPRSGRVGLAQTERYGPPFREWHEGLGPLIGQDAGVEARYQSQMAADGIVGRAWYLRATAIHKLQAAAVLLASRDAVAARPRSRGRLVDMLLPGTLLAEDTQAMLDGASNPTRRSVMKCDLGRLLAWASSTGRDAATLTELDRLAYRASLIAEGIVPDSPMTTAC